MKLRAVIFMIFISLLCLQGCKKNEIADRGYPRLNTLDVTGITKLGAVFGGEISFRGSYKILKFGFVWSESMNPDLLNSDKVIYSSSLESDKFNAEISTTLETNVRYYVRAFVVTDNYTVYGKNIDFISLGSEAPVVTSFAPLTGMWGDTIKITGRNFSYLMEKNAVKLGTLTSNIISSTDTLLIIKVPLLKNSPTVKINVSVLGNTASSKDDFIYLVPQINSVFPLNGTYRDTILIQGINFGYFKENLSVKIGGVTSSILSMNPYSVKVLIPDNLTVSNNSIVLNTVSQAITYDKQFVLDAPVINSFSPDTIFKPNGVITLSGKNMCPVAKNNKVFIEGYPATVVESGLNYVKVSLPAQSIPFYNVSVFKNAGMNIDIAGQSFTAGKTLAVWWHSTWTRKKDFPGKTRHNAVAFTLNGKGYFGTGIQEVPSEYLNDFWQYDPAKDDWTQIGDFPGGPRTAASSFTIGDKAYVGLGTIHYYWAKPADDSNHYKDFYSFDPATGTWTKIADFPGIGRHSAASFSVNNIGHVGTGWWGEDKPAGALSIGTDFWNYNAVTNIWNPEQNFPAETSYAVGFSLNGKGYVYNYNYLYVLQGNNWVRLTAPGLTAWDNIAFTIKNLAYFGLGAPHAVNGTNQLWEWDPSNQSSVRRDINYDNSRWGSSVFVLNNRAYIICGATYKGERVSLGDVWEFDPALPVLK